MIVSKWVNTEPDEGALPALVLRIEQRLPIDSIDALWIFPTRRAASVESTVMLASCLVTGEPARRNVFTVRFTVLRDKKGRPTIQEQLQEHATAPAEAVGRVVDGVVRRLGDEAAQPPRHEEISGNVERFDALIRELGGKPPDREPPADPLLSEPTPEAAIGDSDTDASGGSTTVAPGAESKPGGAPPVA